MPITSHFFKTLFNAIRDSDADPQFVYPFLQSHLDQLTNQLPQHLRNWAIATLPTFEPEQQCDTANDIANFSLLMRGFPLGGKATNVEIAIALNRAQSWLRQVRKRELEELRERLSSTTRMILRRQFYHLVEDEPFVESHFTGQHFVRSGSEYNL
ncbi:tetratricopeptide repeat domain protein [Halomicronema hongdechloris C2206]|uniref:Tetratricopeptide repeat domain protein n=1 Tax=Halomicronema hongdechloris C2206 TaxID=1641165 RepID=A0A1Z3HMA9_9CYAN|nr:hypothetical protein [Halomicronema hongdechloris]ASC71415.1 tetratricopeptide repeat domain protein [Halomicronema hongdechloris C2206]